MMRKSGTKDNDFQKAKSYHLPLTPCLLFKKGQTAMELAVFGAILIFVIGAIVRQALSAGYMQNQQLRAMRQAMSTSYRYSTGMLGGGGANGDASHQTSSILFIEDRLTADSAKYGALDRTPYVVSAAATYSRNLFLPVDAGEDYNLPVYDIFINGRHFPFTTAKFKTIELARRCSDVSTADCDLYPECKGMCGLGSPQFYPPPEIYPGGPSVEWEDNCLVSTKTGSCADTCVTTNCTQCCVDCTASSVETFEQTFTIGCAKLYDVIYNHPGYLEWCTDESGDTACPLSYCRDICNQSYCTAVGDCDAGSGATFPANLTADERFDLNRNGTSDVPGTLGTARKDFFWQWYLIMGFDAGYTSLFSGWYSTGYTWTNTLQRGAGIVTVVDVDGDLKREKIMSDTKTVDPTTRIITSFTVMDMQDGDLDFTRGDSDTGPEQGLQKDVKMYSFVGDLGAGGTYLQIDEGKLYAAFGDASQYIRTAQKKDQIDLIERAIQLSNDTGRFCDSSGNVVDWTSGGVPNPVEVCSSECFSGENMQKTCMNQDPAGNGTQPPVIYVRSRVVDRHGRKWITNTAGDDYVNFTLSAGP